MWMADNGLSFLVARPSGPGPLVAGKVRAPAPAAAEAGRPHLVGGGRPAPANQTEGENVTDIDHEPDTTMYLSAIIWNGSHGAVPEVMAGDDDNELAYRTVMRLRERIARQPGSGKARRFVESQPEPSQWQSIEDILGWLDAFEAASPGPALVSGEVTIRDEGPGVHHALTVGLVRSSDDDPAASEILAGLDPVGLERRLATRVLEVAAARLGAGAPVLDPPDLDDPRSVYIWLQRAREDLPGVVFSVQEVALPGRAAPPARPAAPGLGEASRTHLVGGRRPAPASPKERETMTDADRLSPLRQWTRIARDPGSPDGRLQDPRGVAAPLDGARLSAWLTPAPGDPAFPDDRARAGVALPAAPLAGAAGTRGDAVRAGSASAQRGHAGRIVGPQGAPPVFGASRARPRGRSI
jgi:hypothetical protein